MIQRPAYDIDLCTRIVGPLAGRLALTGRPLCSADELAGAGWLAVAEHAPQYDAGRSAYTFGQWIAAKAYQAMTDHIRKCQGRYRRRRPRLVVFNEQNASLCDAAASTRACEASIDAELVLRRVDGHERALLERLYLAGDRAVDVAAERGVSQARISQLHKAALQSARRSHQVR